MEYIVAKRVFLVVSLFAMQKVSSGLLSEPGCRQFAFEEQVLEKLVVLDHRVKTSLETFENKLSEFQSEHTHHREAMERFRKGLEDDMQGFKDKMDAKMKSEEEEQNQFLKKTENNMQDFHDQIDVKMKSQEAEQNQFQWKAENDTQEFKDQIGAKIESEENKHNKFLRTVEDNMQEFKGQIGAKIKSQEAEHNQFLKEAQNAQDALKVEVRNAVLSMNKTMHNEAAAMKRTLVQNPVLFTARLSADLDPDKGATIKFGTVIQNVGNGYDSSTGMFTAPTNGMYLFTVQMCINKLNIISYEVLISDGGFDDRRLGAAEHGDNIDDVCSSTTVVGILSQGDRVYVRCVDKELNSNSNILEANSPQYFWTSFTGVLIHTTV